MSQEDNSIKGAVKAGKNNDEHPSGHNGEHLAEFEGEHPSSASNNNGVPPAELVAKDHAGLDAKNNASQADKQNVTEQNVQAGKKNLKPEIDPAKTKNPYSKDGKWEEINGLNPSDPGYGIMLEELEWQRRRQRRYTYVLAFEIFFAVIIIATIIYFIITSN